MTGQEREQHLDAVDKLSLKGQVMLAFTYLNENVSPLFDPIDYDNMKELIKLNAWKLGIKLA